MFAPRSWDPDEPNIDVRINDRISKAKHYEHYALYVPDGKLTSHAGVPSADLEA